VQYYHRYVAMMALEDYRAVIRDTTRNMRVLDLCREYAEHEQDREFLEQFRPYIVMVRARALASLAIADNEPKAALHAIDEALEALRSHFDGAEEPNAFDMSGEVQMLRSMRDTLVPKLPVSQMAELRARLAKAIEQENYELAAILRDELKQIKE
jgi:UvrB/uvrC motif